MAPDVRALPPVTVDRLTRRAEFLRVAGNGRKAPTPGVVVQVLRRGDDGPVRVGFTATKKLGNAVRRNRVRRRLREAARSVLREAALRGVDVVLIGRDGTAARPFERLKADLRTALDRAGAR